MNELIEKTAKEFDEKFLISRTDRVSKRIYSVETTATQIKSFLSQAQQKAYALAEQKESDIMAKAILMAKEGWIAEGYKAMAERVRKEIEGLKEYNCDCSKAEGYLCKCDIENAILDKLKELLNKP